METWQIILLGIIQGITEFLPISSSGHLILAPLIFDFQDQGLALDAILHLATLLAIIIFFKNDLLKLTKSLFLKKDPSGYKRVGWSIIWASLPAGLAGLTFGEFIENQMRSPVLVALNLFFWSFVLWWADHKANKNKKSTIKIQSIGTKEIFLVGMAQALALLPGTSRSGITIAAGLLGGVSKETAARLSFLLGAPIILAAGLYKFYVILTHYEQLVYSINQLLIGFLAAFIFGYVSIKALMKIVSEVGLLPFVIYRIGLSAFILYFI